MLSIKKNKIDKTPISGLIVLKLETKLNLATRRTTEHATVFTHRRKQPIANSNSQLQTCIEQSNKSFEV